MYQCNSEATVNQTQIMHYNVLKGKLTFLCVHRETHRNVNQALCLGGRIVGDFYFLLFIFCIF
jgi:hypothetical protein